MDLQLRGTFGTTSCSTRHDRLDSRNVDEMAVSVVIEKLNDERAASSDITDQNDKIYCWRLPIVCLKCV